MQMISFSNEDKFKIDLLDTYEITEELFRILSKSNNVNVLKKLVHHPMISDVLLNRIMMDEELLIELIKVKNCSEELLDAAISKGGRLRIDAVMHPCFKNLKLLEDYSKSESWVLRKSVASNPNTPKHVLMELLKDSFEKVKIIALKKLKEREG